MDSFQLRTPPGMAGTGGAGIRHAESDTPGHESPEAKRRKIRKGTRSCWECKRRKVRCNFNTEADTICIGCRRRGTHCLSQEYPEEASRQADGRGQQIGDRIVRVEALVEQLVKQASTGGTYSDHHVQPNYNFAGDTATSSSVASPTDNGNARINSISGLPTPAPSEGCESSRTLSRYETHTTLFDDEPSRLDGLTTSRRSQYNTNAPARCIPSLPEGLQKLSDELYSVLPTTEDIHRICLSSGATSLYFHQIIFVPYEEIKAVGLCPPERMRDVPPRNSHPVIIAKYLLIIATFLLVIPTGSTELSQPPRTMMLRMVDAASKLVTTSEELMGSVEHLECIMLEAMIQANSGNLRRAWLALRRAAVVAQLMGIHRKHQVLLKKLDPSTYVNPEFMWFRIQYADKYLSLMLGLPQGTLDTSYADDSVLAKNDSTSRLERMHAKIASHILERNEEASSGKCDWADTQAIDIELQKAAKIMPAKWWLPPNLSMVEQTAGQEEIFWETIRMVSQLYHFNLLNQLHLPYMMRFSTDKTFEYSKMACVNASRELLSRFVAFRSWNKVAFCCRGIDFFALMAAMTLVLAHLESHRHEGSFNSLAHQRLGDRAMMEQVLESMDTMSELNMDVLSEKSGNLLRRLLDMEAQAAEGETYRTENLCHSEGVALNEAAKNTDDPNQFLDYAEHTPGSAEHGFDAKEDGLGILLSCPYFGVVKIARDGGISKEPAPIDAFHNANADNTSPTNKNDRAANENGNTGELNGMDELSLTQRQAQQTQPQQHEFAPQYPNPIEQAIQNEYAYPGLAAGADDWAFQGVDMAFFDNLMRGVDNVDGNNKARENSDWGVSGWVA